MRAKSLCFSRSGDGKQQRWIRSKDELELLVSSSTSIAGKRVFLTCSAYAGRSAARQREQGEPAPSSLASGALERAFSDVEGLTGVTRVAYAGPGHVLAAREAPPIASQSGRIQGRPRACALERISAPSTTPSLAFSQLSSLRCTPEPPPPLRAHLRANVVTITDASSLRPISPHHHPLG